MKCWHEPVTFVGNWVFHAGGSRVAAVFQGAGTDAEWRGHFLRYEGVEHRPQRWDREPDGWFVLRPVEPMPAWSFDQARAVITPLFGPVENGSLDDRFEKHAYRPSARPRRVKVIEHSRRYAKAVILEHPSGKFEARYFVCIPEGEGMPALTPSLGIAGWDWCRVGEETATFTDDLELAEKVAADELEQVVAETENVRRRASHEKRSPSHHGSR